MIKELHKDYGKWEQFRVVKRFTIFPLRIYQYTSQTTWWSWLSTTYVFQSWEKGGDDLLSCVKHYFNGGYWKNERMSDINEYNNYINSKQ